MNTTSALHFLVIDDELTGREKIMELLKAYGHCDQASNGNKALSLIEKSFSENQHYDLITLDIAMRGMDGIEVLH